jgi:hypothetical protein
MVKLLTVSWGVQAAKLERHHSKAIFPPATLRNHKTSGPYYCRLTLSLEVDLD